MRPKKLLQRLAAGAVANVGFVEFQRLVEACSFDHDRARGDHHIYRHPGIDETLNLQSVRGQAKPYQIRQFLALVEKYHLEPGG